MKRIKRWFIVVMVLALCLQAAIMGSVEAANTDITLMGYTVSRSAIYQNLNTKKSLLWTIRQTAATNYHPSIKGIK